MKLPKMLPFRRTGWTRSLATTHRPCYAWSKPAESLPLYSNIDLRLQNKFHAQRRTFFGLFDAWKGRSRKPTRNILKEASVSSVRTLITEIDIQVTGAIIGEPYCVRGLSVTWNDVEQRRQLTPPESSPPEVVENALADNTSSGQLQSATPSPASVSVSVSKDSPTATRREKTIAEKEQEALAKLLDRDGGSFGFEFEDGKPAGGQRKAVKREMFRLM